jgi:outer membrane lipoprotein SlyB
MKEPTMKEVLKLVTFKRDGYDSLFINDVFGYVSGSVCGNVYGGVRGNIVGNVGGTVEGDVKGNVCGTINGREWQYVEPKQEKIIRLIREGRDEEAIKVLKEGE